MNLTIEQLSKATKLSVSTIRVYASQRNLGKKVGGKRIFSQADAKLLLNGSKKLASKKPSKTSKKPVRRTTKAVVVKVEKPKAETSPPSAVYSKSGRRSFWSRLFGNRNNQKKVSMMDAKTTK